MGYSQAGFDVVGIDIAPQPRYPFPFQQADALEWLDSGAWRGFQAIHASPPCQGYSVMNNLPWNKDRPREYLIGPVRERLEATGLPYVIENVMGARYGTKRLVELGIASHGMKAGWLCGTMFGLPFYRHRMFETNWFWLQPEHPRHQQRIRPGRSLAGRARDIVFEVNSFEGIGNVGETRVMAVRNLESWQENGAVGVGHAKGWRLAAAAMQIDWMKQDELTQAIPPAYTRYVGERLRQEMEP